MNKRETTGAMVFRLLAYFLTFAVLDKFFLNYTAGQTFVSASAWTLISFGVRGLFLQLSDTPEETPNKKAKDPSAD